MTSSEGAGPMPGRLEAGRGVVAAGVVVVIGLVVTATLSVWVGRGADQDAAERRAQLADRALFVIRAQVDRYVAAGAGAAVLLAQDPEVSPDRYARLLEALTRDLSLDGLRALNAVRRVGPDEVDAFIASQQRLQPAFEPQLAEDADEHGILYRVHPRTGNEAALGFDVYANPDAGAAVVRSLAQGTPQMTDALVLRQALERDDGLVVYVPSRAGGDVTGWVSVVMEGQAVLDAVAGDLDLRVRIVDRTPAGTRVVGEANGGVERVAAADRLTRSVDLYGQTWEVTFASLERMSSGAAWLVGATGLLVTAMLGALVLTVVRSEQHALRLVDLRTRDLARANADLSRTVDDLARASRAKDDLVSVVSHELRTPLTVIRGFASTLQRQDVYDLPEDAVLALASIERNAQRLERVVSDLFLTARLTNGEEQPVPLPVDVAARCAAVVAQVPELEGCAPTVRAEAGVRAMVDAGHLDAILGQLLVNAARYGRAPVTVDVVPGPDTVEVRVADDGHELDPAAVTQLFDRFTQADRGDTRRGVGLGLGLWIVAQLARLNGGDVRVEGEPRTCFVVTLPAAPRQQAVGPAALRS